MFYIVLVFVLALIHLLFAFASIFSEVSTAGKLMSCIIFTATTFILVNHALTLIGG